MRIELRRIQREFNVAVLHVTHDQEEALSLSDTVVLLESGHIVQQGPPEEMYERPATPFVARFLGGSALRGAVCGHQPAGADAFCVQVASRHFRARAPEGTRALQSGSLVIQREWLRLGDGDGAEGHEGIVTSIAYLGGIYELGVRLADGVDVSLRLPSGRCASAAREGAAVTVAQTHDAWFIPDEAATELTRG